MEHPVGPWQVDGADRRVAFLYALTGGCLFLLLLLISHPMPWAGWDPHLSWVWPAVAAVVLAAGCGSIPWRKQARLAAAVVAAVPAVGLGWVAWGYAYPPWHGHPTYWQVGAAVWAAALVLAPVFATPTDFGLPARADASPGTGPTAGAAPGGTVQAEWETRLASVGKTPGAVVAQIIDWPGRAGSEVHVDLPDGTTWEDLKQRERHLAGSLRLDPGCGVEVWPGRHTGAARVVVTTRDTLADVRPYADTTELTGTGSVPVGWYRNDRTVQVPVREDCTLCVSGTGGGKTGWLHGLTAGHVRCPDVLVWQIDLGGAGLALPWAAPYLSGAIPRPVVDWPAVDLAEALDLTGMALQVILHRRVAYAQYMIAANATMLPISPELPAIRIVVDETAEAAGAAADPRLAANLVRIIQLGRAVAVRVDLSALRAVATVLPTDAQQQIGTRALFAVADDAEIGRALGWYTRLRVDMIQHKGGGRIRVGSAGPVEAFRTWRADEPATIAAVAAACEPRRPVLDEPSLAGVSPALRARYLTRWERLVPRLGGTPAHAGSAAGPVPAHPGRGGGTIADALSRVDRAAARAKQEFADERLRNMPDRVAETRWAELAEQLEDARVTEPAADARTRMRELLDAAGDGGMSGPKMQEALADGGFDVPTTTLYRWLRADADDGGYGVWHRRKDRP